MGKESYEHVRVSALLDTAVHLYSPVLNTTI